MKLVIHAPNVHQGGGRALLLAVLEAATRHECRLIVDARMEVPSASASTVTRRVTPSVADRLAAEIKLREAARFADVILCLGNLPPLFRLPAPVALYLQNRNLVGPRDFSEFRVSDRLRIAIERAWLRGRLSTVDEIVVQTPTMARLVRRYFGRPARVLPFLPADMASDVPQTKSFDFIYVASGEPHKNHRTLIEAWMLLAGDGLRPRLCLVFGAPTDGSLIAWIEGQVRAGLHVSIVRNLARAEVFQLYAQAGALIFPSGFESFGLPLLEARAAGLPILASELDYVRDVVHPAQTFDPASPVSIARAVKRHLGIEDMTVTPVSAEELLKQLERTALERSAKAAEAGYSEG